MMILRVDQKFSGERDKTFDKTNIDHVNVWGHIITRREKAIKFHVKDTGEELWIPRSVCESDHLKTTRRTQTQALPIARWWADKENLPHG